MGEPRERPIIFSGPMVRAILSGRKTQTRRVVRPFLEDLGAGRPAAAEPWQHYESATWSWRRGLRKLNHRDDERTCPFGQVGDRLWVRETWQQMESFAPDDADIWLGRPHPQQGRLIFRANFLAPSEDDGAWRPSIYMPRWAARLTLELTDIRVQRLQEISEEDAMAEGIERHDLGDEDARMTGHRTLYARPGAPDYSGGWSARGAFEHLWGEINGKRPSCAWKDNPWVWALTFRRVTP